MPLKSKPDDDQSRNDKNFCDTSCHQPGFRIKDFYSHVSQEHSEGSMDIRTPFMFRDVSVCDPIIEVVSEHFSENDRDDPI